jgi:hypothetical protein
MLHATTAVHDMNPTIKALGVVLISTVALPMARP